MGHEMKYYNARKKIQPDQSALHPDPVRPPWAPVLEMRVIASCWVVHVMEVPGEFTRGKAAQIKDELHLVRTNFPLTHWANSPETQEFCPSAQISRNQE